MRLHIFAALISHMVECPSEGATFAALAESHQHSSFSVY
jgi:hypothetical protein